LFKKQLITVNFLIDDFRFYQEMYKFSRIADSVESLPAHSKRLENQRAFLRKKAAIISRLYLNSDIPPKLRVRCWDPH
ncbi:RGSL protein, partial [Centropus unirufus]|nr:RGSL protein [Centropus unirufus]